MRPLCTLVRANTHGSRWPLGNSRTVVYTGPTVPTVERFCWLMRCSTLYYGLATNCITSSSALHALEWSKRTSCTSSCAAVVGESSLSTDRARVAFRYRSKGEDPKSGSLVGRRKHNQRRPAFSWTMSYSRNYNGFSSRLSGEHFSLFSIRASAV